MKHSFAAQNTFGRFCDEQVYENDVAVRLREEGISNVHNQVPITVSHKSFSKTYRLDLVVEQMVYELKTVGQLGPAHEAQALHYAVMLEINRVKLINFRSPKVVGKLIHSPFLTVNRRAFTVMRKRWHPLSDACTPLMNNTLEMFSDLGTLLQTQLYSEALVHLAGGEERCVRRLPIVRNGLEIGTHPMTCHTEGVAFVVTALSDGTHYESHLQRLLPFLPIRGIQWFNLNHTELQAITIKSASKPSR